MRAEEGCEEFKEVNKCELEFNVDVISSSPYNIIIHRLVNSLPH